MRLMNFAIVLPESGMGGSTQSECPELSFSTEMLTRSRDTHLAGIGQEGSALAALTSLRPYEICRHLTREWQ